MSGKKKTRPVDKNIGTPEDMRATVNDFWYRKVLGMMVEAAKDVGKDKGDLMVDLSDAWEDS